MKKKTGFTLIELLAVIVILAIIALIATPILMRVIENSKKGASERSAENYAKQIETLIIAERLNGNVIEDGIYELNSNGDICLDEDCTKELKVTMAGSRPSSGRIQVENEKVVAYTLTIGDYENKYGTIYRIPREYQEVEYLESTGTQYIDTGVLSTVINRLRVLFNISSYSGSYAKIFGGGYSDSLNTIQIGLNQTEGRRWAIRWGNFSYANSTYEHYTDYLIDLSSSSLIINGDSITVSSNNITDNRSLLLFTAYTSYPSLTREYPFYGKIYFCELYDANNVLIRKFIPCYSTTTVIDANGNECPEGTIGMYDTVNGVFYTNQGTGTFGVGNDV